MNIHMNGVILQVGQPQEMKNSDGKPVLDKHGVQMYRQTVTMQHEFHRNDGTGFDKYVTFDVVANSTNKMISKLNFQPNEELEVALDIDSKIGQDGRWFNSIRCFAVERDKSRWHRPTIQRVATMPGQPAQQQIAQPQNPFAPQNEIIPQFPPVNEPNW